MFYYTCCILTQVSHIFMDLETFLKLFVVIVLFVDYGYSGGNTMLLEDNKDDYRFDCCGFVTTWEYYATTNTGDVYFQVWRDVASSPASLAGENMHTHSYKDLCRLQRS
ncbi:hypothetical protein KUTeg_005583 [Tegillarca granosa]|uniref:Uncharacterized protein n=1 Tax=Tegillarca granosa TaxID=220873 RepID=A0ABQ9FK65_TEGGR|nr:hypothetical protein KUTeg_005583 [Tegillarca granosa]